MGFASDFRALFITSSRCYKGSAILFGMWGAAALASAILIPALIRAHIDQMKKESPTDPDGKWFLCSLPFYSLEEPTHSNDWRLGAYSWVVCVHYRCPTYHHVHCLLWNVQKQSCTRRSNQVWAGLRCSIWTICNRRPFGRLKAMINLRVGI